MLLLLGNKGWLLHKPRAQPWSPQAGKDSSYHGIIEYFGFKGSFKGHLVFPTPSAAWPEMISDPNMAEGQLLLQGNPTAPQSTEA